LVSKKLSKPIDKMKENLITLKKQQSENQQLLKQKYLLNLTQAPPDETKEEISFIFSNLGIHLNAEDEFVLMVFKNDRYYQDIESKELKQQAKIHQDSIRIITNCVAILTPLYLLPR
jgi:hypothetical protein